MALAGKRRHRVRLESPTTSTDGDGGFSSTWALLSPGVVNVSIEPATATRLEQFRQNTVIANVSHIVEMVYHSGVTVATRLSFKGRVLQVVGIQNPEERNVSLVLACVEQVA